jgi:nitroreductase
MPEYMPQNGSGAPTGSSEPNSDPVKPGPLRLLKRRARATLGYVQFLYGLGSSYLYDIRRYHKAASKGIDTVSVGKSRHVELRSWIAADAHKIEKGLALHSPRPGFGKPVVKRLLDHVERYHQDFEPDHITELALNVLEVYRSYSEAHGVDCSELEQRLRDLAVALGDSRDCGRGGLLKIDRADALKQAQLPGLGDFFESRHSVRDFSDAPVSMELVEAAVAMAQKTPSVCNRQSWKAYAYVDQEVARKVLACQQGNRGFGDRAAGVVVITSDLRTFFSYGERNQGFIDGGMFAMSVVYGLHAQGLGACCLNWCAELEAERLVRATTGIPAHEAVIMMIAIGHLPESLSVAESVRKPIEEVCIHGRLSD